MSALEQLRQGSGVKSSLDLLRQGVKKDFTPVNLGLETNFLGTQTTTPVAVETQFPSLKETGIGLIKGLAPRLVTAIQETKEKGVFEAAKRFFNPLDVLRVREERLTTREQEFIKEGKTQTEARALTLGEELASMAIGAVDAGAGKIAKGLKGITKELRPLAQEARKLEQYNRWLGEQPEALAKIKGFQEQLATIKDPKAKTIFLKDAKRELDNKFIPKFADYQKNIGADLTPAEAKAKFEKSFYETYQKGRPETITSLTAKERQALEPLAVEARKYKNAEEFVENNAVGVSEKVKLKEPQITIKPIRTIADEAIKFVKENPDSSLVAKEFRNPRTKELESGPRLFQRIGESIRNGELNLEELPKIVTKYGLSANETARLFEDAATYSGRTLQALSRVEKEIRALLPDIKLPERIPTLWEKFKSGYLTVDNFRRGLLVTQLATAARNAISQTGRYALGTITDGMNGVISKTTGKGEGFVPFFEDIAAVIKKFQKGNMEKLEKVLTKNPIENARLYNTPVGDVALTGKITNTLNAFNRGQEYFFRNLILDAKLNAAAKREGVKIEKLGMSEVERAVDDALEWTFSKAPTRGSFGDAIMKTYRAMPPLTLINPFPRFMSNAVKFLYDYSPAGIMSLFNSKTRAAIAAGDYNAISKAIIGTSMLGGAIAIRANENLAGEKWYEIKYGDKRIDTRAFAPFSTYLFFAELMVNGSERISGSDWAQAAIGINRVAGTGLALIDLVGQKVDAKNAKNVVNGIVSSYVGGFTVPFVTIKDIIGNFRLEERTVKETKEVPIIGGAIGNIPGLNELLPTKYSMFEDKPLQREQSLLRQLTGITLKTKSFIEKELDRMGKDVGDLIPKTGNLEANRIISKQTGVILDQFNEKLNLSEKYQTMGDEEKLEFIKNLVSEAKKEAKGEAASDLAGVGYNELKKDSSEKRKETNIQLKNRGLITENILDYLMPMLEAQPLAK